MQFLVIYVPGSGGNFLHRIITSLVISDYKFYIDSEKGHCHHHPTDLPPNTNEHNDLAGIKKYIKENPESKIIQIAFDKDDYQVMAMMHYKKFDSKWIKKPGNYDKAKQRWPHIADELCSTDEIISRSAWNTILTQGFISWTESVNNANIEISLTIKFKTLLGLTNENLFEILNKFAGISIPDNTIQFINQWREANKQYLIYYKN